jgi:hypothetical protein
MAAGRRCDLGCESWPPDERFITCPVCGEPTENYTNLKPLELDEALSILNHQKFERFYEGHCRSRGIDVEGPLPAGFEPEQA